MGTLFRSKVDKYMHFCLVIMNKGYKIYKSKEKKENSDRGQPYNGFLRKNGWNVSANTKIASVSFFTKQSLSFMNTFVSYSSRL